MSKLIEDRKEQGFTLIELLIAIVVVGILAAVAIVGIAGLTDTGGKSACTSSADAAKTASAAYYANHNNKWPTSIEGMTKDLGDANDDGVNEYEAPANTDFASATQMKLGNGWAVEMSANNGTTEPNFTCDKP